MDPLQQQMPQQPGMGMPAPMSPLPNLTSPMTTASSKNQGRLITAASQSKGRKTIIKNRIRGLKKK